MRLLIKIAQCIRRVYWYIFRPTTYGVKGLLIDDDKVLLIKNLYDNLLYLPGGGVKKNETPEQALCRELKEETGLDVKKFHLVGKYTNQKEYKKDNILLFYIDEYKFTDNKKGAEIDSVNFYPLNKLPGNISPVTLKRIKVNPKNLEEGVW